MSHEAMSPLSSVDDEDLRYRAHGALVAEIKLFRKALQYCLAQQGDDNCWMDYRHLLMRFLPGYNPANDDVTLDVDQLKNCQSFIRCWQENKNWKTVSARTTGTLDCLEDTDGFQT